MPALQRESETSQIPLFETQGRQTFEGGHDLFGHHPSRRRPPPHRSVSGPKKLIFVLFFLPEYQEWPRQTKPKKGQFMNFSQVHSGTKVQCESCLFSQGKAPEFTKMGEIPELFILPLSLVWFAGATPDEYREVLFWYYFRSMNSDKRLWHSQGQRKFLRTGLPLEGPTRKPPTR